MNFYSIYQTNQPQNINKKFREPYFLQDGQDLEKKIQKIANTEIQHIETETKDQAIRELKNNFISDSNIKPFYNNRSFLNVSKKAALAAFAALGLAGITHAVYRLLQTDSLNADSSGSIKSLDLDAAKHYEVCENNPLIISKNTILIEPNPLISTAVITDAVYRLPETDSLNADSSCSIKSVDSDSAKLLELYKNNPLKKLEEPSLIKSPNLGVKNNDEIKKVEKTNQKIKPVNLFTLTKEISRSIYYCALLPGFNIFGLYKFFKIGTKKTWIPQLTLVSDLGALFYEILSRNPPIVKGKKK